VSIHLVHSDIFMTGAKYICHQANCTAKGQAAGIAKVIFEKYPYADLYKDRVNDAIPGTIEVHGDGLFYRGIINMNSQFYPGKASSNPQSIDTIVNRKKWFHSALLLIAEIPNLESVAFPYKIACNLGGGDWVWYEQKLNKFAEYVEKKCNADVLIYKND
jgi:hypothetical protein